MVEGIFCDLEKAFDSVNHDTLPSRLVFCAITGKAYTLIKSYLENRHQRVILKDKYFKSCSSWGVVKHDIPRQSTLGSLHFLLYINDVHNIINNKNNNNRSILFLLADDTNIIVSNPNPTEFIKDINMTFKNINEWFETNSLSLNFDKTNFIQFTAMNYITVNVGFHNITDNTLTWKGHIEMIVPKLSAVTA
jgi:hypothetical protein